MYYGIFTLFLKPELRSLVARCLSVSKERTCVLKKSETVERREERQRDAAEAMAEYRDLEEGIAAKMARLRALRLSKAAEAPQSRPPRELLSAAVKAGADNARRSTVRKRTQPKTKGLGAKLSSAKSLGAETSSKRRREKKAS